MMISILIPTRNRCQDIVPCLRSLLALDYDDFEIIVFDQSTSDETEQAVRAEFGSAQQLRYIRSNTTGKSIALNRLMEAACGGIFAFTDDDTVVPTDWLRTIER